MKKLLYIASTSNHLNTFHMPYINHLRQNFEVKLMAKDENYCLADYDIDFTKKILTLIHFKTVNKIAKILEEEKFDVIILNTTLASFLVRCALKKVKHKSIVINIVHGYFFGKNINFVMNAIYRMAEKYVKKQTDYILVMNQEDYDLAKKYKLCKKEVYKIAGMGIDDKRFTKNKKEFAYQQIKEPSFLFIGELSRRKNQKFILKFIKELKKFNIYATLKLLGEGDYKEKLNKLIKKYKIQKQVEIIGFDHNINKYLLETDYYICASKIEGLPFNILEAMYAGAVVFSSDIKGSVDVIKDFETGILYKFNDVKDLITKFRIVNQALVYKENLSKHAHEAAKKYLLKNIFDDNMKIIEGLTNQNGK